MNSERLLAHYERIADAPDAIARLRRFILDLAVRGKLVRQEDGDEPASELLKRVGREKARLIKSGQIRDKASLPAVVSADMPFPVPSTWEWVRFANIVDFSAGRTPSRYDTSFWNTGDHAWVSIADMEDGQVLTATKETVSDKARERVFGVDPEAPGTILMSFKLTIGKIARLGVPAFHNEAIISIRSHVTELDAYLFKILPQFARQGDTKGAIKGATLNRDSISNILFPLPPLTEQHRIVAKVDELMDLCDRLEAARAGREALRDRLAAVSHARLNAPDARTFQADARFTLDALPALAARADQIKALRQTILNLAVRGKLVPQDTNDEPASELLKRIAQEKARLAKKGITKNSNPLPPIKELKPFELPVGWEWSQPDEFSLKITDGEHFRPPTVRDGIFFLSAKDIREEGVSLADPLYVSEETASKARSRCDPEFGDLLIVSRGATCGRICKVNIKETFCLLGSVILIKPSSSIDSGYLECALRSPLIFAALVSASGATAQGAIYLRDLKKISLPLPPLAEQRRIVAKVDALMALCDRLKASLSTTAATRHRLLDALLAEALAPAEDRKMEAAE